MAQPVGASRQKIMRLRNYTLKETDAIVQKPICNVKNEEIEMNGDKMNDDNSETLMSDKKMEDDDDDDDDDEIISRKLALDIALNVETSDTKIEDFEEGTTKPHSCAEIPVAEKKVNQYILIAIIPEQKNKEANNQQTTSQPIKEESLDDHKEKSEKKRVKCEVCGKDFPNKSNLLTHQRIHTGKEIHKCDTCGKEYSFAANLMVHLRVHTGEKPFECEVCGKRFTTKGSLRKHTRSHTGEKPFVCEICGKAFTSNLAFLKRHMSMHTKPHKCDICEKRFHNVKDLDRHLRLHAGETPYKCDTCGKGFCRKGNLTAHIRQHIRDTP